METKREPQRVQFSERAFINNSIDRYKLDSLLHCALMPLKERVEELIGEVRRLLDQTYETDEPLTVREKFHLANRVRNTVYVITDAVEEIETLGGK
mgnify:CR=1 FL=1